MSYARLKEGVSDVYVYNTPKGEYICHWCSMHEREHMYHICQTPDSMIMHLIEHKNRGDLVPDYTIPRLAH